MKLFVSFSLLFLTARAWLPNQVSEQRVHSRFFLPSVPKIRGVNLGSLFIIEPWMASTEWHSMGCDGANAESDCVQKLGQGAADAVFQKHWSSWIVQSDFATMTSYGLNTVRIPVGYWMREDLVAPGEHFPRGGFPYLKQICQWAADAGLYVIIDMHGAPGAQQAQQAFVGQYVNKTNFYNNQTNYERAYKFLEWMTTEIHTDASFSSVGMIEVLNEPVQGDQSLTGTMISDFYPTAISRIRAAENALGVDSTRQLHVQFMDSLWGAGDPRASLTSTANVAFDDHEYIKYNPGLNKMNPTQQSYLRFACTDNRFSDNESPKIVGEWSLSIDDAHQDTPAFAANAANAAYYQQLFSAQQQSFEKGSGWVYWSWKAQLNDYRWSYVDAVAAGAIPKDLSKSVKARVC